MPQTSATGVNGGGGRIGDCLGAARWPRPGGRVAARLAAWSGAGLSVLVAAAACLASSANAVTTTSGGWRTIPAPAIPAGTSGALTSIAGQRATGPWAAGFTIGSAISSCSHPLLARWDGGGWRTAPLPLGTSQCGRLDAITVLSAGDAWVAGTQFPANQNPAAPTTQALIAHWNGRRWDHVPAPAVPGYGQVNLDGIAAAAADDIWAVGYAEKASALLTRTVTEHWNGHRWRLVPSPSPGDTFVLASVAVSRDGQAWAVGENYFGANSRPFVLHWNGRAWQQAHTPLTANVGLSAVAAAANGAVWAVGSVFSGAGPLRPYALRWNGHQWTGQAWPATAGNDDRQLTAVTVVRAAGFAAIGEDSGTAGALDYGELYARWAGHEWSLMAGGDDGVSLTAVTGVGSRCLWAVGAQGGSGNTFRPHVEVNGRNC